MIVIHYGEIGVKGRNRVMFENALVRNIRKALGDVVVRKEHGRIIVEGDVEEKEEKEAITERLQKIPGIENFSFAVETGLDIEEIKRAAIMVAKQEKFKTFKVATKRANKNFPLSSMKVNEEVGREIKEGMEKDVNLSNPDLTIFIEIGGKNAYVYTKKIPGIGGLPVGSQGNVVALLSGGIDSPVASYFMMKRGCRVIFLHFYNENLVSSPAKVEEIVKKLTEYQLEAKAYFVPFGELQYAVISSVPSRYRMIVYRRVMARVANEIATKEKAHAIITGDSMGQVASQTIENLRCIYDASFLPVLPPLIGMDKREIVEMAKKIGTYDISIRTYDDCCSFMVAKHPATRANVDKIREMEDNVDYDIARMLEGAVVRKFSIR